MRFLLPRAALVLALLLVTPAPKAQAYLGYSWVETAYVTPTSSVLAVPSSYVVPTSYVWPTAYVSPTVYTTTSFTPTYYVSPTAYVVPSAYLTTGYYLPRRFWRRPLFASSWNYYYPTVYYPSVTTTSYSYPVVATASYASSDCEPAPAAPTRAPARSNGSSSGTTNGGSDRRPSSVIDSVPENEPAYMPGAGSPSPPRTPSSTTNPPAPVSPAPEPGSDVPVAPSGATPGSGGAAGGAAAAATGADPSSLLSSEPTRRDVRRPVMTARGILEGKVVSAESGRPEANVRVIVSHHSERFDDRVAMTDALGRYAVNLPEGDWTVRVEMPSRRTYPVSDVTVSGGQITDNGGRDVPSLIIKR